MRRAVCLLLFLWLPHALPAGEEMTTATTTSGRVLRLSIGTAIRMALAKNFQLQAESFSPLIAREGVTEALGRFDPALGLSYSRAEDTVRGPGGGTTGNDAVNLGLSGLTPLGTSYNLGTKLTSPRGLDTRFISDGGALTRSDTGLGLTQPILRGFGPAATLAPVRIARKNVAISEWVLRAQVTDVVTTIYYTYNELIYARENLRVAGQSEALARQLLNENTQRARIGTMTPLDITTARAEAAKRREDVILAAGSVRDNEVLLAQLVTDHLESMLDTRVEIEPLPAALLRADTLEGIRDALATRPDYREAILNIEKQHITVAFQRNAVLPQLDLTGSLNLLGAGRSFGSSLANNFTDRDETRWSAGAVFSLPIPNRAARGALSAAKLTAAQQLVDLKRLEQEIIVRVDSAARGIHNARQRIVSTRESSELARESLEAGEQKLRAGTATTYEVLQLQRDYATAQLAEARARADYNKAVAEFDRQTGTTLERNQISLQ